MQIIHTYIQKKKIITHIVITHTHTHIQTYIHIFTDYIHAYLQIKYRNKQTVQGSLLPHTHTLCKTMYGGFAAGPHVTFDIIRAGTYIISYIPHRSSEREPIRCVIATRELRESQ